MTKTPTHASHAVNTAPISADLRGIEQVEYPPLPAKEALYVFRGEDGKREEIHGYDELNMWAYVDADRALPAAPASPAQQDDLRTAALQDSAYAAGMLSGWNYCIADDHATFSKVRGERMTGAVRALKEAGAAAPAPAQQDAPAAVSRKCLCTFSQRVVGDGCQYCNPQDMDRLHHSLDKHRDGAAAAPASQDAQDAARWLQPRDLEALERFMETTDDAQDFDIGKNALKRLAAFGCVQNHGFGRYGLTCFGSYVLNNWSGARVLPFKSQDEWNAALAAQQAGEK